jgi:hypothetical protein
VPVSGATTTSSVPAVVKEDIRLLLEGMTKEDILASLKLPENLPAGLCGNTKRYHESGRSEIRQRRSQVIAQTCSGGG